MELAANRHHKQGECAQPIGARAAAPPTGPRRRWSCEGHCRDRCGLRSSAAPENHSMKVSQRPGAPNDGRLSLCGVLAGCTPPRVICKCCTAHDQHLQALVSPQGFRMELLGVSPRGRRQKRLASGARQPETHAKQAELCLREHRRELLSTRAASDARHPCRRPQRRPISLPGAPDASSLLLPPGWGFSPVGALRPPPSGPAKGPVHWYAPPPPARFQLAQPAGRRPQVVAAGTCRRRRRRRRMLALHSRCNRPACHPMHAVAPHWSCCCTARQLQHPIRRRVARAPAAARF